MHPNQKPQKNLKNYVRAVLYFFALEIHITFGPVKENFRLGLVFEINFPKKKLEFLFFGQNINILHCIWRPIILPLWEFYEKSRFSSTLGACISMTTGPILKSSPIKRIYTPRYADLA